MRVSRRPEPSLEIIEQMRHPVPMAERPDRNARRRVAIEAIAAAIRDGGGAPRRRSLEKLLLGVAVAATIATAALWFSVRTAPGGAALTHVAAAPSTAPSTASAVTATDGVEVRVLRGTVATEHGVASTTIGDGSAARLGDGDEMTSAAESHAQLLLPRGVQVTVGASTQLSFIKIRPNEQRLRLALGRVDVSVPKPGGPSVFSVETPDSEVVVHGTVFSVLVERDPRSSALDTTVSVTRGSVFVTHAGTERLLEPGATWSSRIEAPVAAVTSALPNSESTNERGGWMRPRTTTGASPTSLTEQNRLFQAFLDARDTGDDARAVRTLDEFLTRFPHSPLADQARLARLRTLERLNHVGHGSP